MIMLCVLRHPIFSLPRGMKFVCCACVPDDDHREIIREFPLEVPAQASVETPAETPAKTPVKRVDVGPWIQSTIDADPFRKPLDDCT
jgi:hypothetical protein